MVYCFYDDVNVTIIIIIIAPDKTSFRSAADDIEETN